MATGTPVRPSVARNRFSPGGRGRVAARGGGAVLIAAAGLSASLLLQRTAPTQPQRTESAASAVSGVPIREQWYLEAPTARAATSGVTTAMARDRWYLDQPKARQATTPKGDTWYLGAQTGAAMVGRPVPHDVVRDRWYAPVVGPSHLADRFG